MFNAVARRYSANDVSGEVMTLKLSTNKSMRDCLVATSNSLFALITKNLETRGERKPLEVIMETVEDWMLLIKRFIENEDDSLTLLTTLYVH